MLKLTDIVKSYSSGSTSVQALKGVSIEFRENEFVSILGPSGCGKTTMLNIIGGLDRYDNGDLSINGRSTKQFKDSDWDTYRNHSIGFVFQNYNLIPHQTVLANVELALTLSGVSKAERRKRATEVLQKVGLGDQLRKKPNQMSGGQMQRVAIARALVNNPEILLADEPTGALDSETSVQIMELLKEIAKEKLIIMVTHNPELAEQYSSRIVRLLDGNIIDDSNPYNPSEYTATSAATDTADKKKAKKGKTSMSLFTAFSLSLNNLMTKKGRTLLTAFAGSIGIIGIALILSLSNGFQLYIDKVQEDTLSSYPLTIQKESVDLASMVATIQDSRTGEADHDLDKVYSSDVMSELMNTMVTEIKTNNLADFKKFIETDEKGKTITDYTSAIQYTYDVELNVYKYDTSNGVVQVNPSTVMESMGMGSQNSMGGGNMMFSGSGEFWSELLGNQKLLDSQYDILAGRWPEKYNEVVIAVNKKNEISDVALYSLGLKDQSELEENMKKLMEGETVETKSVSFTYDDLLNLKFKLLLSSELYSHDSVTDTWFDISEDEILLKKAVENGVDLQVVGIVRPNDDAAAASINGAVGYTHELVEYIINEAKNSKIVKAQMADPDTDIFTGVPFESDEDETEPDFTTMTPEELAAYQQQAQLQQQMMNDYLASLPEEQQQYMASLSEEESTAMLQRYFDQNEPKTTYEENLIQLGVADLDDPSAILLYPVDFESKESIEDLIKDYNSDKDEEEQISYTDIVGIMMKSVSTIINMISYVLIAFVSISLVVSSIMIGIITYISVLERTKEIGILRSIGASKKDVSRVFNAETLIIGFVAGALGIGLTLLLNIPVNQVIQAISGIANVSQLPWKGAVILVLISMGLTLIAGLIPSGMAAKKDPVVALRTE